MIHNPYYAFFLKHNLTNTIEPKERPKTFALNYGAIIEELKHKLTPKDTKEISHLINNYSPYHAAIGVVHLIQYVLSKNYSWAIPTPEVLSSIAQNKNILNVSEDNGYWSYLLKQLGCNVLALSTKKIRKSWFRISKPLDFLGKVKKYKDRTLLLIWPPYNTKAAYKTISAFVGEKILYVGEWLGGCGDTNFHNHLLTNFSLVQKPIQLLRLGLCRDYLFEFERKKRGSKLPNYALRRARNSYGKGCG